MRTTPEWDSRTSPFEQESSTIVTRTYTPKTGQVQRDWVVIDANDGLLGRLASQAAALQRGEPKRTFGNHVDVGDSVVIINAGKLALSGRKRRRKRAYRHSGYPGGLKSVSHEELREKSPGRA